MPPDATEAPAESAEAAQDAQVAQAAQRLDAEAGAAPEAEQQLDALAAESAEAEAATQAAEEVADDDSTSRDDATFPEVALAVAGGTAAPDEEPVGWFREEPIDADLDAALAGPGTTPTVTAAVEPADRPDDLAADELLPADELVPAGEPAGAAEPFVRERDRPAAVPLAAAPPPRRGRRVRGVVIGVVTIAAVAAVGFVAGLMLPTILPGPGLGATPLPSGAPSQAASPTPAPTATAVPTAAPTPSPAAEPPTPAPTPIVYVVKAGDQLTRIAATFGVTVAAIQEANNITNPNLITVGQKLIIPLPEATPAP